MEDHQIIKLGEIIAELVRALGMFSTNQERLANGNTIAYGDEAFEGVARNIEYAINQLR